MKPIIATGIIERKIYLIRSQKVMLDSDLAELYAVETFNLNKASSEISIGFRRILCFRLPKTRPNV